MDVLTALHKGAVDVLFLSEDLEDEKIEELEDKADNIGAKTMILSIDIQEGKQLKEFGVIDAILRFKV